MAKQSKAVRQRYDLGTGGTGGVPGPGKPRFAFGGRVPDKASENRLSGGFQKYGNGFRKTAK